MTREGALLKREESGFTFFVHLLDRIVFHIEEKVTAFSVIFMALILITNVVFRWLDSSLASTEELSQFLMFFITFLGTSYAARTGMHIRMSMLSDVLKGKAKKALALVVSLLSALILLYLAWLSYRYVVKIAGFNRVSPILQVPVQYVWMIMPVGLLLTSIQYFLAFVRNIISPGAWISFSVRNEAEPTAMSDFHEKVAAEGDAEEEKEEEKKEDRSCSI